MKIAHICLSCFYIDARNYQENELVRQHVADGHEVLVIASTETHNDKAQIAYTEPGDYIGPDGARVIRLPYRGAPAQIARKLRIHPGVYDILADFAPDAMLFHGLCGWEIMTAARYKRANPRVIFYIDSHEDPNNSARGFVSREFLHRRYYGPIARRAVPAAEKVLCVTLETIDFVEDMYRIPRERLKFFPLAGTPLETAERARRAVPVRAALGLADHHKMLLQSGKQTRRKKLIEALEAFARQPDPNLRLFIVGRLFDDIKTLADVLIAADPRVTLLGWKTPDELTGLLCAADVYLQPGTQSATMQASLCAGCAVIIDDVPSHAPFHKDNGWLLNQVTTLDAAFAAVSALSRATLATMGERSSAIAFDSLNYRRQAELLLHPA
jgi:1,2-diacylglycerol 3-alpha-glucosyltransferase